MININTIIETLVPNYKHSILNNNSNSNHNLNISKYDYDIGENYQSFIKCFIKSFDKYKYNDFILIFLQLTNINKNINRKKLINIIKHNIINNEVILLISGIFECNIWIYYEENNIFKVYYLEENFNKNKKNVIISFGKIKDSIEYGYQMCYIDNIKLFDYNHQIIQSFLLNYLIIPIGLEENKKLIYNDNDDDNSNPLLENLDQIIINENLIFKALNLVKE
jgi:hypothetical protein